MLAENVLPLSENTATGTYVLMQGVELGILRVPLHNVHLKSDLVLGTVVASTRFPEAGPLRNIIAPNNSESFNQFFTLVGLLRSLKLDQDLNFMSGMK